MNILVIHEAEYIDKMVFEYQIIPEIWANSGHRVFVIDYPGKWKKRHFFDFGYQRSQTVENVRKSKRRKGVTLIRPAIIKIPLLARLTAAISYFFVIPRVIKKYEIERIFLYSVPTNGLQTIFFAKKYKIPIHFRLLDVLHQLVPNRALSKPTFMLEKIVYPRVDELTAITPKLAKYAISMGADKKTASYLPSASDESLFFPRKKNKKLLKKLGIREGETVVLFAGTLYNFSGLDKVLSYFARHKLKFAEIKFVIVGNGEQTEILKKIIREGSLQSRIVLTGFIQYNFLPEYINLADVCINPFEINAITNIIFPGKIYQYLACGKPVIATKLAGLLDLFPDNGGKHNIYYYNSNKPEELFRLFDKVKKAKVKDTNPSLREIAATLERQLKDLKVN